MESVWFGDVRFGARIFPDYVVPLTSPSCDLQRALAQFAAEREAAGMRGHISGYLWILLTGQVKMDCEINWWVSTVSAVMKTLPDGLGHLW